ncbi:MAG: addiction module antidote protein, HigA family [Hyphomicrobium sp.]|jgi:addiction module HigA family antidote|nr:addiction module antidote protein, HigA family [Hyphomicrobium sp.]PPD08068.1 MAG: addiction module antidote protein, HigA family [Hyphomicrobium sp.]
MAMYKSLDGSDAAPLHPGEILRVDILPNLAMTPAELASHLGVPRTVLDGLLSERNGITPDLAQRLGLVLGHGAHHWLALQMQYDLWKAAEIQPDDIRPISWSRRTRSCRAGHASAPAQ